MLFRCKYWNTHIQRYTSIQTQWLYTLNDRVLQALHKNTDNAFRWRGKAMSNRQAFKQGAEPPYPSQWTDSLWPEIQAASGCQTLLCFDTHCCPQQKERGKTAVKAFVKTKFTVHLCFSSYWMHKQTSQWGAHTHTHTHTHKTHTHLRGRSNTQVRHSQ